MLTDFTIQHRSRLTTLADSWLASRAKSFSIWESGRPLASWPAGVHLPKRWLSAEIKVHNEAVGELRVAARNSRANQLRLMAEAELIAGLAACSSRTPGPLHRPADVSDARVPHTRLESELLQGQRIQTRLLPLSIPNVDGLDIYATTHAASGVNGDFYDFLTGPELHFTFAVCDIAGKGVPAALMTAMTRMVIRTNARTPQTQLPAAVVGDSNSQLYEDFTMVSMLATMFVGQYHPTERSLVYSNAGHSPVIFCPADGEARLLEADGTPIGVLPTNSATNQHLRLAAGDVLVVGTDGLSEARNRQGEMFGYLVMMQLISQFADRSASEIGDALHKAVRTFAQNDVLDDDLTMVVCKAI